MTLATSLTGATQYKFPIGQGTYNAFYFSPSTNATASVVVQAQVFDGATFTSGNNGLGINVASATQYWSATTSGAGTLSSWGAVVLNSTGATSGNLIGYSSTSPYFSGTYNTEGGTVSSGVSVTTTGSVPVNATNFFAIGTAGCLGSGATPTVYTVGSGQQFTNLASVAAALNTAYVCGNLIFEFQTAGATSDATFPITFNAFNYNGGWTVIIRPKSTVASTVTVSGSGAGELINLNGVDNLKFDGRPGGSGTSQYLTISNTGGAGDAAFQFINGATTDSLENLVILSTNTTAAGGTVVFSTTTSTGNTGDVILGCNIGNGATAPATAIYSNGTSGNANSSNTIINNNIYNFTTNGISVTATDAASNWTISNNSFYFNTGTPAATQTAINFLSGGNNITISTNTIGGNASVTGGSAASGTWTNSTASSLFTGIALTAGTTTASNIQGNIIQAITLSGGTAAGFTGINVISTGNVNIGTTTGNTIGIGTGSTASISCNGTGTTTGINCTSTGTVNIGTGGYSPIGNTIGNITCSAAALLRGIVSPASAGTYTIDYNTIMNLSTAYASAVASPATVASTAVVGIAAQATTAGQTISQNTITGLTDNAAANLGITGIFYTPYKYYQCN